VEKKEKQHPCWHFAIELFRVQKTLLLNLLPPIAELSRLVIVSWVRTERLSDFAGGLETKAELPALEAKAIAWMKREEKN